MASKRNSVVLANLRYSRKVAPVYIGIDGEGIGRKPSPGGHRYILLAASTEDGLKTWWVEAPIGQALGTEECLDFILGLAQVGHKIFAYSFNYDLTKILTDLENKFLYYLFRSELRIRKGYSHKKKPPHPVRWNGFDLGLLGTKFSLGHGKSPDRITLTIWDISKFYQSKFVNALIDWKVQTKEELAQMQQMKDSRNVFQESQRDEIRAYCLDECKFMGQLAHRLVQAHDDAGLTLTSFYGAGSSASSILKKINIKDEIRLPSQEMFHALASAFFGGRFENGKIGSIPGPAYNFDISSAYPYHISFLPCLKCGTWELTYDRREVDNSRTACVEYSLEPESVKHIYWGPFPFRTRDGSICFPSQSGGGWVWKDEYLSGEKNFAGVKFKSAWIYKCKCNHKPFLKIRHYYRERCRIGKEGAGIVFKLGPNSVYGKLAQSIGSSPFNSWIWAGMITSGCRAQVLDLISLHQDRSKIILIATDGVLTLEDVIPPTPIETHTGDFYKDDKGRMVSKPLGGWERTVMPRGVFAARPGIYFEQEPDGEELKKIRGRGVGKKTIADNASKIIQAWNDRETPDASDVMIEVRNLDRFCGAKSCLSRDSKGHVTRASGGMTEHDTDLPDYGQWISRRVAMSFDPMPKRLAVKKNGVDLALRKLSLERVSTPYSKAVKSQERKEMELAQLEQDEQPDGGDLCEPGEIFLE